MDIRIMFKHDQPVVYAKDFYIELGLDLNHYSHWIKRYIVDNCVLFEEIHYYNAPPRNSGKRGRKPQEFYLTMRGVDKLTQAYDTALAKKILAHLLGMDGYDVKLQ